MASFARQDRPLQSGLLLKGHAARPPSAEQPRTCTCIALTVQRSHGARRSEAQGNEVTAPRAAGRRAQRSLCRGLGGHTGFQLSLKRRRVVHTLRASLQQGPSTATSSSPPPLPQPLPQSPADAFQRCPRWLKASELSSVLAALSGLADALPSCPPAPASPTRPALLPGRESGGRGCPAQAPGRRTQCRPAPKDACVGTDWFSATSRG